MKKFRTARFNGYQRNEVDEYLAELMEQTELLSRELKEEVALREELQQKVLEFQKERQRFEEKFQKERQRSEEESARYAETEDKLRKYESDYSGFMALMVNMKEEAKKSVMDAQADAEQILRMAQKDADDIMTAAQADADGIMSAAQADAEKITKQAEAEADDYKENMKKEMGREREKEAMKLQTARIKVTEYLDSLNRSQNKLIEVYEEFGRIMERLPLRIGDMLTEEPFAFLDVPEDESGQKREDGSEAGYDSVQ